MTHPFTVTCFRYDVGIFTAYGARLKQFKVTNPIPPRAVNNLPVPRDPRFIDTLFYDVVLFTNPELTQSFTCYRSKNLHKSENYLNNFMILCSKGYKYIDLARIPDEPFAPPFPPHPCPPPYPHPYYPPFWGKNDSCVETKIPDSEIDPRYINDPRKNPWYDVFDHYNDPRYAKEPKKIPEGPCECLPPYELDYDKLPKYDGDIVTFEKDCHPKGHCPKPPFKPEPPCPPFDPPYQPCHHHHPHPPYPPIPPCPPPPPFPPCPPCPPPPPFPPFPPCPPPFKDKICIYHGDGGFAMGESVISNIAEIAPNALRTMIAKNYHSTFSNMNPPDRIVVNKHVLDCILPTTAFKVNMSTAGEWCFFMIPDKYYKLVRDFNWYYKEDSIDGKWIELDRALSQTTFSIQDNGIKYFINAIRLNGRYDMRFAKTGRDFDQDPSGVIDDDDNRELDPYEKFRITLRLKNLESTQKVVLVNTELESIRTFYKSDFILDEVDVDVVKNNIYKLSVLPIESQDDPPVAITETWFLVQQLSDDEYAIGQTSLKDYSPNKTDYNIYTIPPYRLTVNVVPVNNNEPVEEPVVEPEQPVVDPNQPTE